MEIAEKERRLRGSYRKESIGEVLRVLRDNKERPLSAEEVSSLLKQSGTDIGLTTVYRRLSELLQSGQAKKHFGEGKTALYRYTGDCTGNDDHLVCTVCGCVTHVSCNYFSELYRHIGESHGFRVDGSRTLFYGTCSACYRASKHISNGENRK